MRMSIEGGPRLVKLDEGSHTEVTEGHVDRSARLEAELEEAKRYGAHLEQLLNQKDAAHQKEVSSQAFTL